MSDDVTDPAPPPAKVARVSQAILCEVMNRGPGHTTHDLAIAAIRAADAWEREQRRASPLSGSGPDSAHTAWQC